LFLIANFQFGVKIASNPAQQSNNPTKGVLVDANQFLEAIKAHPYFSIALLSIFEGKATAFFAAYFAARGHLNPWVAYAIFCAMTVSGDAIWYLFGLLGSRTGKKVLKKTWLERLDFFAGKIEKRMVFALSLVSLVGKGAKPVILLAGASRMPFRKFMLIVTLFTPISYAIWMGIGYWYGLKP